MLRKLTDILHTLCAALAAVLHRRRKAARRTLARAVRTGDKATVNTLTDELTKDL